MRSNAFGRWMGLIFGRGSSAHRYSEADLLARTDEFNQSADSYWRAVAAQESGRRHVVNRPFAGPTAAVDLYRLGLLMAELRPGPGLDVLDFGAGTCWLSSCLNRMGCRTIAMDVSQAALDLGREVFGLDSRHRNELNPRFLVYDGHRFPLEDASVDRIACYDAFHHVPNQDDVLREMYRVLRSGGRVVMAEPGEGHSHSDASTFDESAFAVLENDFDVVDIERRARLVGFSDVRVKPYLDPTIDTISPTAYAGLGGQRSPLRLSTLRAGVGVAEALRSSFRSCSIVVLTQGADTRDSRAPGVLRAELRLLGSSQPLRGHRGTALQVRVQIRNIGDTLWRSAPDIAGGSVMLGCHLCNASGGLLKMEHLRIPLLRDVAPGAEAEIIAAVPLPPDPGKYVLRFDPLVDNVVWFSQLGSRPLDVAVEIIDADESGGYRASIEAPESVLIRLPAGSRARLPLRVRNTGAADWPRTETLGPGSIRIGAQLFDAARQCMDVNFARADLPQALASGESCDALLEFKLPTRPGGYSLKIDLLQEEICWFAQRGSPALVVQCEATAETTDSAAPGLLLADLELFEPPDRQVRRRAGDSIEIHLSARNVGNTLWRHAEGMPGQVRVGAMLESGDGVRDYWRASLPNDVAPGATAEIRASMPAPITPGEYTVLLDLVDEGIAWFKEDGSPIARFGLTVEVP